MRRPSPRPTSRRRTWVQLLDLTLSTSSDPVCAQFCVVMVSKPKAAPVVPAASISAAAEVPSTPMQPTPAAPVAPDAPAPAATAVAEAATPSADAAAPAGPDDGSGFLVGSALQTSIDEMVSMGFPLDQVKRALRASYNNPHRAVDYLMNVRPVICCVRGKPMINFSGSH